MSQPRATEIEKRQAMEYMTYPALYEFFGTLSDNRPCRSSWDRGEAPSPQSN